MNPGLSALRSHSPQSVYRYQRTAVSGIRTAVYVLPGGISSSRAVYFNPNFELRY